MTNKILVTGGAGFIGIHTVVELVKAGMEPIIVDNLSRSTPALMEGAEKIINKKLKFYQVDCIDRESLRKVFMENQDIQSVIHFAAFKSVNESVEKPLIYYQNNLGSLTILLECMREFNVTNLVFSSSCTVYGEPDIIPVTESAPFKRAESAYGATKQICERILEDEVVAWPALRVFSLRYFNPIGAHPSGLIGELPIGIPGNLVPYVTQTAIGKREKLTVFGDDYDTPDGSCLRDFIHVVDVAEAHVKALQKTSQLKKGFEAVNLGSGIPVSVLELVKSFITVTGVDLNYVIGPRRSGDVIKTYADPTKSFQVLNWKTRFTLEDGLRDAWRWEQNLKHATH